ncbi:MAG: OmpA family protein [Alphaproteobacteria bacterium]|nr:OmpA family protein [Alphaproteobacteria bacterium]
MKTRTLLLGAVASLALAGAANAREINGWYIGLEGGGNWIDDLDGTINFDAPGTPNDFASVGTEQFDTGWAVLATVGYGFGGNWRAEFEGGYRDNKDTTATGDTGLAEWSAMINVLYDIHLTPKMNLSLGAGVGADFAELRLGTFKEDDTNLAYQGIVGLSYELTDRLDLTMNYRYLRVTSPEFDGTATVPGPVTGNFNATFDDVGKHTATIGLRYAFGSAPAPEPMVEAPPPPPPAAPEAPRQFIIFFGFNKCNITAEADGVLSQAADSAKQLGSASIQIVGHTDTSGSPKYNQKLSECRANAAKTNLTGKGVAAGSISASGKGEGELMVQTADGVKEPQNRRAQIDLN